MKVEDFSQLILKTDSCWVWLGSYTDRGYGRVKIKGVTHRAHRLSFKFFKGPLSPNEIVLHNCDNPGCVNPDHLSAGTHMDNHLDKISKGRQRYPGRPPLHRSKEELQERRRGYWRAFYQRKKLALSSDEFKKWCAR